MTNQEIIKKAPKGWTHHTIDKGVSLYFKIAGLETAIWAKKWEVYSDNRHSLPDLDNIRARDDIERIEQLEMRNAALEKAIEERCVVYHSHCDLRDPEGTLKKLLHVNSTWSLDPQVSSDAAEFALRQQIKGAEDYTAYCQYSPTDTNRKAWIEKLNVEALNNTCL